MLYNMTRTFITKQSAIGPPAFSKNLTNSPSLAFAGRPPDLRLFASVVEFIYPCQAVESHSLSTSWNWKLRGADSSLSLCEASTSAAFQTWNTLSTASWRATRSLAVNAVNSATTGALTFRSARLGQRGPMSMVLWW